MLRALVRQSKIVICDDVPSVPLYDLVAEAGCTLILAGFDTRLIFDTLD